MPLSAPAIGPFDRPTRGIRTLGRNRTLPGRLPLLLAGLAAAVLVAACGGPPPTVEEPLEPGYLQLRETFGPRDFAPLRGRRIVIDPGHGGFFRGALGPSGLNEADVNLGVALHLRGLLEWAGAEPHLTRTADRDFLGPRDSTLVADLAFRVAFADSLQPDVFLSIHHNSTAARDSTINETQTYYPLQDDGASRDLARSIHRHLVRNLEIQPARILPGNFHVLRNATVPAVLGEPAMISHPVMERRLSLAASQKLEAEAYFLGLLDYFRAGTPDWSGPRRFDPAATPGPVVWRFLPDGDPTPADSSTVRPAATPGPDPSTYRLTVNGRAAPIHVSPDGLLVTYWFGDTFHNSDQRLVLNGRNLAGRAAPRFETMIPAAPTRGLEVELLYGAADPTVAAPLVRWQARGGPLTDTGRLDLTGPEPLTIGPGDRGWVPAAATVGEPERPPVFRDAAGAVLPVAVRRDTLPDGWDWRLLVPGTATPGATDWFADRPWRWRSRRPAEAPVPQPNGAVLTVRPADPVWVTAPGLLPLVTAPDGPTPVGGSPRADARIVPMTVLTPELAGSCIVLDPAGGAGDPGATGPTGLRASEVNLALARAAASALRGAGARVVLTRTDGVALSAPDKIRLAERAGADLFLTLRRTADGAPTQAGHHPGSEVGSAWASGFAHVWNSFAAAVDSIEVVPSWAYLLRHTACPALELALPGPDRAGWEPVLEDAGWMRAEARAILLSTWGALSGPASPAHVIDPFALLTGLAAGGESEDLSRLGGLSSIERIEWDGNFQWTPLRVLPPPLSAGEPAVESVASMTGPGVPARGPIHILEIHTGERWQLWSITAEGGCWAGDLLFESD